MMIITTIQADRLCAAINGTHCDNPDAILVGDFLHCCHGQHDWEELFAADHETGEFIGALKHGQDLAGTGLLDAATKAATKMGTTALTLFALPDILLLRKKGVNVASRSTRLPI